MLFRDREDAGRQLARSLEPYRAMNPIVLGLPRGGVPVADEVARALGAPLDVWIVRKIGAPFHRELGLGAISEGGQVFLNDDLIALVGASNDDVANVIRTEEKELARRVRLLRGDRVPPELAGRTVILVDDGIATGGTAHAAARAIRAQKPARLVLAVPVAATESLEALKSEVDDVVCLLPRHDLRSIGEWYEDFGQTTDDEVVQLLARARGRAQPSQIAKPALERTGQEQHVIVNANATRLEGDLAIPPRARGLVLFAHGSGSSRKSPRNRAVASALRAHGLATLLFDLLTPEEDEEDAVTARLRFDIDLLAGRLVGATDWTRRTAATRDLPLGYFGASTGAAAALIAATERPNVVQCVVSRGGRPDLAGPSLWRVRAPTLLIVGGEDIDVLALNEEARKQLRAPTDLSVVAGATHLFEEPGALDEVARMASEWFVRWLSVPQVHHAQH